MLEFKYNGRNTNKEDRVWMRKHADTKLDACKNAIVKKNPIKKKVSKLSKIKVGQTQDNFEKMKRSKP